MRLSLFSHLTGFSDTNPNTNGVLISAHSTSRQLQSLTLVAYWVALKHMLRQNRSSERMMAILQSTRSSESICHDETLHYLILMCSKVILNALVLCFWRCSIYKSFLGICSISIQVVDVLLVGAVFYIWLFKEATATSMCFILAHGSNVYTLLPLPILIAGAFDYATYPNAGYRSQCRAVSRCVAVVLLWTSACLCSYLYTDTQPKEFYIDIDVKALACPMHGSTVTFYFCTELVFIVGVVLLLYFKELIGWLRRAKMISEQRPSAFILEKEFSYSQVEESGNDENRPPVFVSLTLCFALSWMPYLFVLESFELMGFVLPAYASVNLLWMACANSALAGFALWHHSGSDEPFRPFPDDSCAWSVFWHLSKGRAHVNTVHLSDEPYVIVHKSTPPFQNI
ncbi:probable G-protein coupled receptor 160 [Misgurnus anguillicaudatus]|uniref:probable G-protein coupled receptor 160 n=1 Tax=Misgurnus anguillicaudatus TaxID=75329 RepID=UPI003CCFD5CF